MENALQQYLFSKAERLGVPVKTTLELTPLCNMHCRQCYIRQTPEEVQKKGGLKDSAYWKGLIPPMKEAGVLFLALIGGEIFTHPELEEIYMALHRSAFYINFTTNGTALAGGVPEYLKSAKPRYATVSVYGASDETYEKLCGFRQGFTKAVQGIEALIRAGIPVKLNFTALPENRHEIGEVVRLSRELDLPLLATSLTFKNGLRNEAKPYTRFTPEEAAEAETEIKRLMLSEEEFGRWLQCYRDAEQAEDTERYRHFTCRGACSSAWISWDGQLSACGILDALSVPLEAPEDFQPAWNKLRKLTQEVVLSSECASCNYRTVCPVCPAGVFTEEGSFDAVPKYFCEYTKALARRAEAC